MALTPEQYIDQKIDRNIKTILENIKPSERVGEIRVSRIQRILCIGYNQACHTLDEMNRRGLIEHDKPCNTMGIYRGKTQFELGIDQRELIVDNFAGGGGASSGIEDAVNHPVDIAINHDPDAIAMHKTNHPLTKHYCESVWDVDPVEVCAGRPVGLAWFSPDCKHFSKAKGGKPVEKAIRGLAWIAVRWSLLVRQRITMLENVEEFTTWGPIDEHGQPIKARAGETFEGFKLALSTGLKPNHPAWKEAIEALGIQHDINAKLKLFRGLGYTVEHRELRACDYGAPTIRKRFFLIARCDGQTIVWPEPTHGDPNKPETKSKKLRPWRTAAECIDWSIPCPSIFERARPLAENTLRRIAKGIQKFVIESNEPFIVTCNHSGDHFRGQGINEPMKTVTASRDAHGLVMPVLSPFITEHANASSQRNMPADEPLRTICAQVKGGHFAIVAPVIARQFGNSTANDITDPLGTVTAGGGGKSQLVAAFMTKFRNGSTGYELDTPVHTITSGGEQKRLGTANTQALVTSHMIKLRGTNIGSPVTEPVHTVTAGGLHLGEVRAFLIKYYGTNIGHSLNEPLQTITAKHRFGLVMIHGEPYQIVDIGMRMLEPHELFAAQGFASNYIIDVDSTGTRYPKAKQVARCGNSVPPPLATALVRANYKEPSKLAVAA